MDAIASPPYKEPSTRSSSRTVTTVMVAFAAVFLACWLLYRHEASQIVQRETDRESLRVTLMTKLMQSELSPVTQDVQLLADGDGLRSYLASGAPDGLRAAIRRAEFMSKRQPAYAQIRYIDENGQEVFHVNGGGVPVEPASLPNQATQRYFVKASQLPPGALYLSAFDLDIENGSVKLPPTPKLRLAVPTFDSSGKRRGIYIVDFLGATFITRLEQALPTGAQRLRILNSDGYWLRGRSSNEEWGFMSAGGLQFSLARDNPALWKQILLRPEGQSNDRGHVFTWRRLLPAQVLGVDPATLEAEDDFLVIASEMMPADWSPLLAELRQMILIVSVALLLLTGFCLWLFLGWRKAMWGLRGANEQLERRVVDRTAELTRSNELLREQEHLLEQTGRLAKVGGWEFYPSSGEGRWTDEIARIHDVDPQLEPNKQFGLQFYPGESRKLIETALQKSIADGTPYDLELEFVSAQGAHKWVRTISRPVVENGKVIRMRGTLQDVTVRKITEIKLKAQLQRLHLLEQITRSIGERHDLTSIFQVTIGAVETELPLDFGCIALYDPAVAKLTVAAVAPASDVLAASLGIHADANIPIDTNGLSRSVSGIVVYEPDIAQLDAPFPRLLASGGLRALVIAPLQIESKVFGVLIGARFQTSGFSSGECEFLQQLSEHVALAAHQSRLHEDLQVAYESLRTTQHAVMQQERLSALGQMASGIAHDINNAISPVSLYTESLLEREPDLSERARRYLVTIQRAIDDVARTVARMREFYREREDQITLARVDLNSAIRQVVEFTRPRWNDLPQQGGLQVDLQMQLADSLPEIMGAEHEIRDALTNLIFNSIDAMPEGGTITVKTRTLLAADGSDRALIEVRDTGVGMDEDTRRRCLEPFYTTKGERGSGLGLAMVYGMVQRHSAEIEMESAVGAGTTMRLSFPAHTTSIVSIEQCVVPRAMSRPLRILLVDDDPVLIKSLQDTLQEDGHFISATHGGQAGIDAFTASHQAGNPFDVVVTDLGMPQVDGRKVALAIKEISATTPVVLLTGWGQRMLAANETPAHVDRVLSKPPRLAELRTALVELLS